MRLLGDGRGLGLVEPAFVGMSQPSVEEALERCRRLGAERIAVVPLLLFTGVLVGRIAERATAWAADHPGIDVVTGEHLGADPRLAAVVAERHREAIEGDVRMNCDVCAYRVRLPGYEDKVGTPLTIAPAARTRPAAGAPGEPPTRRRPRRPRSAAAPVSASDGASASRPRRRPTSPRSTSSTCATPGPTAPRPSTAST